MDWDGCVNLAQSYLENSPLIVLGSGASMPYGLPSMRNLAEAIEADPVVKDDPEFANLSRKELVSRSSPEKTPRSSFRNANLTAKNGPVYGFESLLIQVLHCTQTVH